MEQVSRNKNKWIILCAVFLLGIVLAVMIFAISGKETGSVQEKLLLAERYMSEMNYEQAVVVYKSIIEIDPKNVEAYLGLAEAYIGQGMYQQAENCLKEGYDRTNDEKIADKIEEVGKQIESIESVNETSQEDTQDSGINISQDGSEDGVDDITGMLTNAKQDLNVLKYENALEEYKKVLELDPENVEAFLGIIEVLLRQGKYDEALIYAQNGYDLTKSESLLEKIEMINRGNILDCNGNILKKFYYAGDGSIRVWCIYEYNSDNKVKNITVYDADGKQTDYGDYVYNENGDPETAYYYNPGEGMYKTQNTYDKYGRISMSQSLYKDGRQRIWEYYYNGQEEDYYKIIGKHLHADGYMMSFSTGPENDIITSWSYNLFDRDEKGNIIRSEEYSDSDLLMRVHLYKYDANGNNTRLDIYNYNSNGEVCEHLYHLFEYDKDGNQIVYQRYNDQDHLLSEYNYDRYGNQIKYQSYEE